MTAEEAASFVDAYITARNGSSGMLLYAGSLQSNRGKSVGSGGSLYSQLQTQIVKPTQPKPIPPEVARQTSANNYVVCYNCAELFHTSPHCPLKKPKSARLCYIPTPTITPKVDKEPTVSVLSNGRPVTALVNTGCARALVQAEYVPRDSWTEGTVTVCCVHGDKSEFPTAEVYVEINGQPYLMKVGIATTLPYPVLLGTDRPILTELVQETAWCGIVTRAQAQKLTQSCQSLKILHKTSYRKCHFFTDEKIGETK